MIKGKTKEAKCTCAVRIVTSTAYGKLDVVHHGEVTSCSEGVRYVSIIREMQDSPRII